MIESAKLIRSILRAMTPLFGRRINPAVKGPLD